MESLNMELFKFSANSYSIFCSSNSYIGLLRLWYLKAFALSDLS